MSRRDRDFSECNEIVRGSIHELEHTDDWEEAMNIAADHLRERSDYYEVLDSCMDDGEVHPNGAQAALIPIAIELATTFPKETATVLNYAAMVAIPPYGLMRATWAAGKWARGRVKRALGYEQNGIITSALRPVVTNLLKWLTAAYQLAKGGVSKIHIVEWLKKNGFASRLATAMADAVINVVAQEAAEGVRAGGRAIKTRALSTTSPPPVAENGSGARYYVWAADDEMQPLEGPWGPYQLQSGKTYARIAATKGDLHRIVTFGRDPGGTSFEIVRIYEAGTGQRMDQEA